MTLEVHPVKLHTARNERKMRKRRSELVEKTRDLTLLPAAELEYITLLGDRRDPFGLSNRNCFSPHLPTARADLLHAHRDGYL
jgi:hypothetical protein